MRSVSDMSLIELSDLPCAVRIVHNSRARRFTLRMDPQSDDAILTLPPGVPNSEINGFLKRHAGWLRSAVAKRPAMISVRLGGRVLVGGIEMSIMGREGRRRAPVIEQGKIVLQGPGAAGPRIAAWLKLRARDALQPAVEGYAAQLGKSVKQVALRDTRSRWGSCSTSGTLSFSWRLAMAPPEVQDYVAAHEAAHLVEMNHSPKYWAVVERILPDWRPHRAWLRKHGRELHAYRFTDS